MRGAISTLAVAAGVAVTPAAAGDGSSAGSPTTPVPTGEPAEQTHPLVHLGEPAEQTHPLVHPRRGHPTTTFRVYGTTRIALGVQGVLQRAYRIPVVGPARRGCASAAQRTLSTGARGSAFRADFAPPESGWCRGRFAGTVVLHSDPLCPRSPIGGHPAPCPAFATYDQRVGRFSFRVR